MRTLETSTEQFQWLTEDSRSRVPAQRKRSQRCSDFLPQWPAQNVLFVGAERGDEFAYAMRLTNRGHRVLVVNPHESVAARDFADAGGTFIRTTIERIPLTYEPFDLICENYPFTLTRIERVCEADPCPRWFSARTMQTYAMARLKRLAQCGRWIVFTESPGFARALRSMIHRNDTLRKTFSVRFVPLSSDEAPRSAYPHLMTRFRVSIQRRPEDLRRIRRSVGVRKASL